MCEHPLDSPQTESLPQVLLHFQLQGPDNAVVKEAVKNVSLGRAGGKYAAQLAGAAVTILIQGA